MDRRHGRAVAVVLSWEACRRLFGQRSSLVDFMQASRRVRQKAGLNCAILDQGWAELGRQLACKTAARGGTVVSQRQGLGGAWCQSA